MKLLIKKSIAVIILFSIFGISFAEARSYRTSPSDSYVGGYTRKNGTYVAPYYRSKSDGIKKNNYSCYDHGKC